MSASVSVPCLPQAGSAALLEFLRLLPEELDSRHLSIHPNRRNAVLAAARDASAGVLSLLDAAAGSTSDPHVLESVLEAFAGWAQLGGGAPSAAVCGSRVCQGAFQVLVSGSPDALVRAAEDAACAAVSCAGAPPALGAPQASLEEAARAVRRINFLPNIR